MERSSTSLIRVIVAQILIFSVCQRKWQGLQVADASVKNTNLLQSLPSQLNNNNEYSSAQAGNSSSPEQHSTISCYSESNPARVILQYSMGRCIPTIATNGVSHALTGQQTTNSAMRVLRNRVSQFMHDKKLKHVEGVGSFSLASTHSLAADLPSRFLSALHMEVITAMPNGVAPDDVVRLSDGIPCIEKAYRDTAKITDDVFLNQRLPSTTTVDQRGNANQEEVERADPGETPAKRHSREQVPPNDPYFKKQWNLRGDSQYSINAETAWKVWNGHNRPMIIAVIDSGCDIEHPDLVGNMWNNPGEICGDGVDNDLNGLIDDCHGWDFTRDSPAVAPEKGGHGTSSAGVAAASANNLMATAGVCWGCKVMCLKFFGTEEGLVSNQLQALNYALRNGAWISNNSYGGYGWSELEYEGIRRAQAAGHLFVASAGNHDVETDLAKHFHTPSAYPLSNIISVGASTQRGRKAEFSNYGKSSVHIFAPGTDIFATGHNNGVVKVSGTSFASPHVAGAAGLVWSAFPNLTYAQIKTALLDSCRQVSFLRDKASCGGIVDAYKALRIAARISEGTYALQEEPPSLRHTLHTPPRSPTVYDGFTPSSALTFGEDNSTRSGQSVFVKQVKPSQRALWAPTDLSPFPRSLAKHMELPLSAQEKATRDKLDLTTLSILRKVTPLSAEGKSLKNETGRPLSATSREALLLHHRAKDLKSRPNPTTSFILRHVIAGREEMDRVPHHSGGDLSRVADSNSRTESPPEVEWVFHPPGILAVVPHSISSAFAEVGLLAEAVLSLLLQKLVFI